MTYAAVGAAKGLIDEYFCGFQAKSPSNPGVGGPTTHFKVWDDGSTSFVECCPGGTWSNAVWLSIGGEDFVRAFNEIRIRSLKGQFETAMAKGAPGISSADQARLQKAFQAFDSKFPHSRWQSAPGPTGNPDCTGSGTYPTLVDTKSVPLSPEEKAIIMSVPRGGPQFNIHAEPLLNDLFLPGDPAKMGSWLQSFVDFYAPKSPFATSAAAFKPGLNLPRAPKLLGPKVKAPMVATPRFPLVRPGPTQPQPTPSSTPEIPTAPEIPKTSMSVQVAVGVVVLGAFAYFLVREKR